MIKWNPKEHKYYDYKIPNEWYSPLYVEDLDTIINCASCGKIVKFGECFTSKFIHNHVGLGYSVCYECHMNEWSRYEEDNNE